MPNKAIVLENLGPVTITDSDFVRAGGEAQIFRVGANVVKLYHDPHKMKADDMVPKLKLLTSKFSHPHIVGPRGLVTSKGGSEVLGYWMPFASGEHYPRLFSNAHRKRIGFGDKETNTLVAGMRDAVTYVHQQDKSAVLVDPNELNWLAYLGSKGWEPRLLDLDSLAIGKWPAKVISPAVKDHHTQGYTQMSDWFSVGVVMFQLYAGTHPYAGELAGYACDDLERRMRDKASVFHKGVLLNRGVRDFNTIPAKLRQWFMDTFESGQRTAPPSPFDIAVAAPAAAVIKRVVLTVQQGNLEYDKLLNCAGDSAARIFSCGVVLRDSGALYDLQTHRTIGTAASHNCEVVKVDGGWILVEQSEVNLKYSFITEKTHVVTPIKVTLQGSKLVRYENRLFLTTHQGLTELRFMNMGTPIISAGLTWAAMPNSTEWFDGVGVMDAHGAMFVISPFSKEEQCGTYRVKELDGFRPVAAKAGDRFICIIAADKLGRYSRFNLTLSSDHKSYQATVEKVTSADLNMCFRPNVVVEVVEDGEMKAYVPANGNQLKVQDKDITTDMVLAAWGDLTCYINAYGDVCSVKTAAPKKP